MNRKNAHCPALGTPAAFTLLETILAIGLFAVAAIGVVTTLNTAGELAWEITEAEREALTIRSVLEEVMVRHRLGDRGSFDARVELEDGTAAGWRTEPVELFAEDGRPVGGLVRMLIEVELPEQPVQNYEVLVRE